MRIKRLELRAFGPFTNKTLDFSSDLPGLHVIYGPNEAGKTSAMRALHALLFGFGHRSGDDFVHPYNQLLVGACLQAEERELVFYRRKKSKNDLFDAHDNQMDAADLAPFLRGLDSDIFSRMYGITHEALVQGGQGILDQHGEVGQSLFAAAAGFASLKAVLDSLESEADALFRPRASKALINQALSRYVETRQSMRDLCLSGQKWQAHHEALTQTRARLTTLTSQQSELAREIRKLERIQQALPFLGELRLVREKLRTLGHVQSLPGDFSQRRQRLEEELKSLQTRLEVSMVRKKTLEEHCAAVQPQEVLLLHAEEIEALHERLGAYRKAQDDWPIREGQRIGVRTEAGRLLRQIRQDLSLDQAETLRLALTRRRTIQTLGQQREAVQQAARLEQEQLEELRQELTSLRHQDMGLPPDPGVLLEALAVARKAGDLDQEILDMEARIQTLFRACQTALHNLGLWTGALAQVQEVSVPLPESVDRFDLILREAQAATQQARMEKDRLEQELDAMQRDLRELEHSGCVPTESELLACRARRDQGWQLVRAAWLQGLDVQEQSLAYDPDQDLPLAYERSVEQADQSADRMYREADRVRRQAALLAGESALRLALEQATQRLEEKTVQLESTWKSWQDLWTPCGLTPLSPHEMRAWMVRFEALKHKAMELEALQSQIRTMAVRRDEIRTLLMHRLGENCDQLGPALTPVLARAEQRAAQMLADRARRDSLDLRLRELDVAVGKAQAKQTRASRAQEDWQASWAALMGTLGLDASTLPAEAEDYLETAQQCLAHLDTAEGLRKRLDGMKRDALEFEEAVRELAARLDSDNEHTDAPRSVIRLKAMLAQAVRDQAVRDQRRQELDALEKELGGLFAQSSVCEGELSALRSLAKCEDNAALLLAEARWAEFQTLQQRLNDLETDLAALAEGRTPEELETSAQDYDSDELPGRIAALREELSRLDPEIRRESEQIGQEKNELARMDGSNAAATLHEDAQAIAAALVRMLGQYKRLKIAAAVLRQEAERYRETHQGPVLTRASIHFKALTLGSFDGLRADLDKKDSPVLIGVRPGGAWVEVDGMSSGTRDQLYLALRLASLEQRAKSVDPLPFVVDDILINFDEARSLATLRTLAGLGKSMQVLLFTHQRQIANMAQDLTAADPVMVHEL